MDTNLFDYELPPVRIAQSPATRRDASKLLVVNRLKGETSHHVFSELPDLLPTGSQLFRNVAAVLKARIHANLPTGGKVECLLLHPGENSRIWWCLVKPGRKLQPGKTFGLKGIFSATIQQKDENGQCLVQFDYKEGRTVQELAEDVGQLPLPPYINRSNDPRQAKEDNERYQTVYANPATKVAVAAPTAGLHFTQKLLTNLENRGFSFHDLLLHVGLGTFKPIQTEKLEEHPMHSEAYSIPPGTLAAMQQDAQRPRVAIGTTCVRTIEDALRKLPNKMVKTESFGSEASLFLYPPENFMGVDALITNFHLPRSTLLCLVAAFLTPGSIDGIKWLKKIYTEALKKGYRFYSYGDAMLIL
ncbi:MAG: tRNA preQ1(34) S-adenosylmethionine ribosyltransferase-isomerase QueA [Opitutae bacterium]|nr:tRNA preQ1(34) S-adenosylmethionine ribosyltransferase-isomerase QueA [Opitutae bacterium]